MMRGDIFGTVVISSLVWKCYYVSRNNEKCTFFFVSQLFFFFCLILDGIKPYELHQTSGVYMFLFILSPL